ncbi:MAG: substrate-binding domain-containing protein [Gemmobacter sp.]|nr:substrate-binding domain-containing protein [Gemmobacter sp.]
MPPKIRQTTAALCALLALTTPLHAGTALVAVDAAFAPVAAAIAPLFAASTGHEVRLSVGGIEFLDQRLRAGAAVDVLLAADPFLPTRLAALGLGLSETRLAYAASNDLTREAILLRPGTDNPAARAFLDFLLTPEVWDVIVAHGFGAH